MESKRLRVNIAKTKVMINNINQGPTFTSSTSPCGAGCKGVGFKGRWDPILFKKRLHLLGKRNKFR